MSDKLTGVVSTTELRMPRENLSEVFKSTEQGTVVIGDEALARLISQQAKLPDTAARAAEVTVSVSVKF